MPWLAGWTAQRTAGLLFLPPALMLGLRWVLQWQGDRQSATPALPLLPVASTAGVLELLWPVAAAMAVLLAAGLLLRRLGGRRVMLVLGLVWLLLWLGGSAALLQRHWNQQGLWLQGMAASGAAPVQAQVQAQVLSRQFKQPSLRGLGGTALVLQVSGLALPQRLLIDDARATALKPGDRLALQLAPGRFSGLFVTGWQAEPAEPSLIGTP
ncbi:hypothetical protein SAMN05216344_105183 [Polaromonas sp. OV174]|uniref:hypothetical protein n=1 Tax=Polaromonas sp. OV174 TaxID=1855300 RepID=UPI0008F04851|nr:hypothetical protein [Polaromonas sp. OV174]SFB92263.1 hypothetical protein SAMN05216344_105183 [Polaromonas sp. OV174]